MLQWIMHLDHPLATVFLTVIGGAITLVLGQILIEGFLEPALELKREIGKIAYSLVYYANRRFSVPAVEQDQTREVFRAHASRLREISNMITAYWFWRGLLWLPSKSRVMAASRDLIGHSNFPAKQDGVNYDRAAEIRVHLGIID